MTARPWINPFNGYPAKLTYENSVPHYAPLVPAADPALTKLLHDALSEAHNADTRLNASMWSADPAWNRISLSFAGHTVRFDVSKLVEALRPRRLSLRERIMGRIVV